MRSQITPLIVTIPFPSMTVCRDTPGRSTGCYIAHLPCIDACSKDHCIFHDSRQWRVFLWFIFMLACPVGARSRFDASISPSERWLWLGPFSRDFTFELGNICNREQNLAWMIYIHFPEVSDAACKFGSGPKLLSQLYLSFFAMPHGA